MFWNPDVLDDTWNYLFLIQPNYFSFFWFFEQNLSFWPAMHIMISMKYYNREFRRCRLSSTMLRIDSQLAIIISKGFFPPALFHLAVYAYTAYLSSDFAHFWSISFQELIFGRYL